MNAGLAARIASVSLIAPNSGTGCLHTSCKRSGRSGSPARSLGWVSQRANTGSCPSRGGFPPGTRLRGHLSVHVRVYSLDMSRNPHEVLPTREARAQLPAMLERFRRAGADAEPVVIGARRRPEAVVLSYERYRQLSGGRERVRAILERQAAESGGRP